MEVGEGLGVSWAGEEKPLPTAWGDRQTHTEEEVVLALGPFSQIPLTWAAGTTFIRSSDPPGLSAHPFCILEVQLLPTTPILDNSEIWWA